mgnify:CR=1 FL=1
MEDLEPEHVVTELKNRADAIYAAKEKEFTPPIMREVERVVLLRNVDQEWMDHIDAWNSCRTASACGLTPSRTRWWSTVWRLRHV